MTCLKFKDTDGPYCHASAIFAHMHVLLPIAYFPPISYFAWLIKNDLVLERKEHFVKQSLRSRCEILGANGTLHLNVPKTKVQGKEPVDECEIFSEIDWKTQHWRSLEAAYRNSPFFDYYADELKPLFEKEHTYLFQLGLESTELICEFLNIRFEPTFTSSHEVIPKELDLRNAWNKRDYSEKPPVKAFPEYIQVFSDRHAFVPDLSILDLLFCLGPQSVEYLKKLELNEY